MTRLAVLAIAACSSPSAPPATPVAPPAPDAAVSLDAAPASGPAIDPALDAAPAVVFRYHGTGTAANPPRLETWTLRHADGQGMVVVTYQAADGQITRTARYLGTASDDGKSVTLALTAGSAQLALTCTRAKLPVAAATAVRAPSKRKPAKPCSDEGRWIPERVTTIDVLSCKHPDFAAAMPFATAPGIEYLFLDDGCVQRGGGYRAIPADGTLAPVR